VLVVVAVIALLIAILLPSLRQARVQSRRTVCQGNIKQLAFGWHGLLEATKGQFPQYLNVNKTYGGKEGSGSASYKWPTARRPLNRYLSLDPKIKKNADLFRCPDDRGTPFTIGSCYDYEGNSYYTNDMMIGQTQMPALPASHPCAPLRDKINQRLAKLNRSKISNESRLVLLGDATWWYTYRPATTNPCLEWHDRKHFQNLAFMDGHASFVEIKRGLYVTPAYTVIPFRELQTDAANCQQQEACR